MKLLLKLIPKKTILKFVWELLEPILQKRIADSHSKIDDFVYIELKTIILRLLEE